MKYLIHCKTLPRPDNTAGTQDSYDQHNNRIAPQLVPAIIAIVQRE